MIKKQHGYLLVVITATLVILGLIGSLLISMYVTATRSSVDSLQSNRALYVAKSGLELAKRNLLKEQNPAACKVINYENIPYQSEEIDYSGRFSVTGVETNLTTNLGNNLDVQSSEIRLTDNPGLLPEGIVVIDGESIWYSGMDGLRLLNVKRGFSSNGSEAHLRSTAVIQDVCTLTSKGEVFNSNNHDSKNLGGTRVLQEMLWKAGNGQSGAIGNMVYPMEISAPLVTSGSVNLGGNALVKNLKVNDSNIVGTTIVSGANVTISGNAGTIIGPPPDGTPASTSKIRKPDINDLNSGITTANDKLWHLFFHQTKNELYQELLAQGRVINNCNNFQVLGTSGITWLNCNPGFSQSIGSPSKPVILIINSNLNTNDTVSVYGFVYVMRGMSMNGGIKLHGQVVVEGAVDMKGNAVILYDDTFLKFKNSNYEKSSVIKEIFQ